MIKDLLDGHWAPHTGNATHRPVALFAGINIYIEHPFQSLGPGHGNMAFSRAAVIPFLTGLLTPLAPACWCDECPGFAIRYKHAVEPVDSNKQRRKKATFKCINNDRIQLASLRI